MKMVTFRLNRECREISVNPAKVLYVSHYETGASSLHFGKECFVRVQGEMSEVVRRVEEALNGHGPGDHVVPEPHEVVRAGVN